MASLAPTTPGGNLPAIPPRFTMPAVVPVPNLARDIRGIAMVGGLICIGFFGVIGLWAGYSQIASAAIAMGVVSPDGSRRTIQHLEGGIVQQIDVKDGSVVTKGQPLMVLDDVQARASYDLLQARRATLTATQARLISEQLRQETVQFPSWLLDEAKGDNTVRAAVSAQQELFDTNRRAQRESRDILKQRIAQLQEEIGGTNAQMAADTRQLELIKLETDDVQTLLNKGLERKARLLALQRTTAQLEGDRAERQAQVAKAKQTITETELQIISIDTTRIQESSKDLATTQADLAEVEDKITSSRDILKRTVINAPVDGVVMNLRYHTTGGVVRAGDPILEIVPQNDELLIDAKLSPHDIDVIHAGLKAEVLLTAYKQRITPRIFGIVREVSADAITDEKTGQSYYKARIEVSRSELDRVGKEVMLTPGMPAEVFIQTGVHSVLDYILQPIYDAMHRTFIDT